MAKKLSEEDKALREAEKLKKEQEKFKVVTEEEVRSVMNADVDKKYGWFILQTHAGKEAAAKRSIEDGFNASGASKKVGMVLMPEKVFAEIRGDKIKKIKRKMYPGYLFIVCERKEDSGELTREIDNEVYNSVIGAMHIHGFSGQEKDKLPKMISRPDIDTILRQIPKGDEVEQTYKFDKGTPVKIVSGNHENFVGEIEEVLSEEEGKVRVKVVILQSETFIDVKFSQIEILTEKK